MQEHKIHQHISNPKTPFQIIASQTMRTNQNLQSITQQSVKENNIQRQPLLKSVDVRTNFRFKKRLFSNQQDNGPISENIFNKTINDTNFFKQKRINEDKQSHTPKSQNISRQFNMTISQRNSPMIQKLPNLNQSINDFSQLGQARLFTSRVKSMNVSPVSQPRRQVIENSILLTNSLTNNFITALNPSPPQTSMQIYLKNPSARGGKSNSFNTSQSFMANDHTHLSTASSFISNWRGKNDRFTGGFMNLMYQDNSLQSVVRQKNLNSVRLEKLKQIEELQKMQEIEFNEKRQILEYYYRQHGVVCDDKLIRMKTKAELIFHLQNKILLRRQIWAAKVIQRFFKNKKVIKFRKLIMLKIRHKAATKIQQKFKEYKRRKIEAENENQLKIKASIVIQKHWKGYFIRKNYEPPIKKKMMAANFDYFEQMRKDLIMNAVIIIRYHWIKYKINKQKKLKKQSLRRENLKVRAKIDTGLAYRKMTNQNSAQRKQLQNNQNQSFEQIAEGQIDNKHLLLVSPMIRQKLNALRGQELESPYPKEKEDAFHGMQTYEFGVQNSPLLDRQKMMKPSPAFDNKLPFGNTSIYSPSLQKTSLQVAKSTFENQGNNAGLQNQSTANQNIRKQIGNFELEPQMSQSPLPITELQGPLKSFAQKGLNTNSTILPQGIMVKATQNSKKISNRPGVPKINTSFNSGTNGSVRSSTRSPNYKIDTPKFRQLANSPNKQYSPGSKNTNMKQGQRYGGLTPSKFQTKGKFNNLPTQTKIVEEPKDDNPLENSGAGLNLIQLSTLDNIIEQDEDFTPDNRGHLVKERFQKQTIVIEQALLLQQQYEEEMNDEEYQKFAMTMDGKKTTTDFTKIDEESVSDMGNDQEEELTL